MNNIISLSGGKDSTAMLHMMLDRGEKIDAVVFFDTGWEFPEMYDHIDLIERKTGLSVVKLQPRIPFGYLMFRRGMRPKNKDNPIIKGFGWPSPTRRWCTREKVRSMTYFSKEFDSPVQNIGFAYDEKHRAKDRESERYPLIESGITEKNALEYCFNLGYTWGGLYNHFRRLSCFCCPLQRVGYLRTLRTHYPKLWALMLKWGSLQPDHSPGFKDDKSVHHFEKRFAMEDRQMEIDFTCQHTQI